MNWDSFIRQNVAPMKPYVPGQRGSEIAEHYKLNLDEILKLSSNESPFPPFPRALEAGGRVLSSLNRYPDGSARALKSVLTHKYGVPAEQIAVGNGSNEILIDLALACLNPGDEVVYSWPSFIVYRIACELTQAKAVEIGLNPRGAFNLEAILEAITDKTKIVFLCNPNNPTGGMYSREEFAQFMERVPAHVLVVVDEAYIEFASSEAADALSYFDGTRPLAILRTFSKMYALAGVRVGYAIAPAALVDALDKVREPFNVNIVGQAMAAYSLDDAEELARRKADNAESRRQLESYFHSMKIPYFPSQTNFVFAFFDDSAAVEDELKKQGVIVRPFPAAKALRIGLPEAKDIGRVIEAISNALIAGSPA